MALALKREQFTYRSLLMLAGAVLADYELMQLTTTDHVTTVLLL